MDEARSHAQKLLRKADEELQAASCLANAGNLSLWTVGFHAQQAVEKALKAALMMHGIRYPFTHDIEALIKLVRQTGLSMPPSAEELSYMTPFATLFRYEEEMNLPDSVNGVQMLAWAENTVAWARTLNK